MQEEFKKAHEQVLIEKYFRHCYEEKKDGGYGVPQPYSYYEPVILDAIFRFPNSLSIQNCAASLDEEVFIENDADVAFHRHLAYFPPIWHTNRFFVVQIVIKGEFTSYVADRELHMQRGNICIIAPGARHALGCFSDVNVLCILIRKSTFENAFLGILQDSNSILADFFSRILYEMNPHPFLHFQCKWDTQLSQILYMAYHESLENKAYRRRMLNSLIDNFFIMLLRNHEKDVVFPDNASSRQSRNLILMMRYIQDHYTTVTLKELSSLYNYSERQIQRIIKTNMGLSFTEIIENTKMKEAARLLKETHWSVTKIADILGYNNLGNFREIFRKTYGKSPLEYRKFSREITDISLAVSPEKGESKR